MRAYQVGTELIAVVRVRFSTMLSPKYMEERFVKLLVTTVGLLEELKGDLTLEKVDFIQTYLTIMSITKDEMYNSPEMRELYMRSYPIFLEKMNGK